MTLDVAIATWKPEGILRVADMNLPEVPGVRYVVSWQLAGPDPVLPESLATRDDVFVCYTDEPGVGANRKNACSHCKADIILNSDDDLTYTPEQLLAVIHTFETNPHVDFAIFKYKGTSKNYPPAECDLTYPLPKNFYGSGIEMAFRHKVLDRVTFDPRFGAPLFISGEDTKFLYDAIKAGFHCRFFPITICTHDHPSTGDRPMPRGVALATGKLIRLEHPRSWILRIPLKAWRNTKIGGSFFPSMFRMFHGALIKI